MNFFRKKFKFVKQIDLRYLDSMGYILFFLNKVFFKNEVSPSTLKIFIWDKLFTPLTIFIDFILGYKHGKCILAIYRKY